MEIKITRNGTELTAAVDGRLDTTTSPELGRRLDGALDGVERLVFDFKNLKYISSAGLRVMLTAMQAMGKEGETVVRGASDNVLEVFEITGLTDDLIIEEETAPSRRDLDE